MDQPRESRPVKTSRIALAFLLSFLSTILLLQWYQQIHYPSFIWIILGFFGFLGIVGLFIDKIKPASSLLLAATLGFTLAFASVSRTTHIADPSTIDTYAKGKSVTITGIISEAPDNRQTSINYTIDAKSIKQFATGSEIPVSGLVLTRDIRLWPRYDYGDEVVVYGMLDTPKPIESFAYDNYLSKSGIYATMRATKITLISEGHGNPVIATLITLRDNFESQINRVFPEPHASFLAGLLTGSRKGMPAHLTEAFKQTGLSHIVAISGFNITIIISIISGCLFFLPLKWRFAPSVTAIILFTLFVGASASVVRAAIMGILGLIALQTGRLRDARLALLWTAFLMVAWNPKTLWYDAGFHLSFLAVIGLMEAGPILKRMTQNVPEVLGIREGLMMTLAAQVFAMPWVVAQFGLLSIISPIANILVAPLIPLAMLFGFLSSVLSYMFFPLGQVIGYVAWGLMELIILITEVMAAIPYSAIATPKIGMAVVIAYYIIVATIILWINQKRTHH